MNPLMFGDSAAQEEKIGYLNTTCDKIDEVNSSFFFSMLILKAYPNSGFQLSRFRVHIYVPGHFIILTYYNTKGFFYRGLSFWIRERAAFVTCNCNPIKGPTIFIRNQSNVKYIFIWNICYHFSVKQNRTIKSLLFLSFISDSCFVSKGRSSGVG